MSHQPSITNLNIEKNFKIQKDLNLKNVKSEKNIEIFEVKTTEDASILIAKSAFQSKLKALSRVIAIKFPSPQALNIQIITKPRKFDFNGKRKLLISFESTVEENKKIIFWRCQQNGNFSTLKLIHESKAEVASFARDFLIECMEKPDFSAFSNINSHSNEFHLIDLCDSSGQNLLLKAVSDGNLQVFNELLKLPFDLDYKLRNGKTAADIAWENKYFEILLQLLKANSNFPVNFDSNEAPEEIKSFLKISLNMHDAIRGNNVKEIEQILKENQNIRHFYDAKNTSAITTAILTINMPIYKLLSDHDALIGSQENVEIIFDSHNNSKFDQMKIELREFHSNIAQNLPEKHLMIHYTNSVIGHDNKFIAKHHKLIKSAFELLNSIKETNLILKIIAARKNFKIHFDFNRSSVQFMDPFCGTSEMTGLFHSYGHIYIAMKEILDEVTKCEAIATMAHEFDHFALVLVFGNEGKPYTVDDKINEEKFKEIVRKYEKFKNEEKIVGFVYENYHPEAYVAELIVRVPQMIVFYHENQEKLNELRKIYSDLFEFYENFVMPKMQETLPIIEKLSNNLIQISFNELNETIKSQIIHAIVRFQGKNVKFIDIVGKNSEIFESLKADEIREILYDEHYFKLGPILELKSQFYAEREFIDYNINTNQRIKTNDLSSKLFDRKITRNLIMENIVDSEYNMEYNEVTKKYEWNEKVKKNLKTFEEISKEAEKLKMILLTDHAGAGKSTTFKHFVGMLKEKTPQNWVSFIDLKRHLKIYEKNKNIDDVTEILLEILNLKSELEIKIFQQLFHENRVILMFDGVDEISPKFKDFFINLIANIRKTTKNQQWIATRPQHAVELIQNFKPNVYKLLPYNDDYQRENFIKQVLESYDIVDEIQQEIALNRIFQSEELYTLNINNPLMLHMVTEIYIEDENLIKNSNMFSIYEGMIEMKKKILIKKGEIVNQDRENQRSNLTIWDVHMVYALKLICGEQMEDIFTEEFLGNDEKCFINLSNLSLLKKWKKQKSKWTPEMISRYGFLYIDNWNTENEFPDFAHRTFAEFFVAKWLIENIFMIDDDEDEISDKELQLRLRFLLVNMCSNFTKFIYVFSFLMTYLITEQKNGMQSVNERFSKYLTSEIISKFILKRCEIYIGPECNEMKSFLYFTWVFCYVQSLSKIWKFENGKTFLQKCYNECDNFNRIRFLLHGYKGTFGANFFDFTGYKRNLTRRPNLVTENDVNEAFEESFLNCADFDSSHPSRLKLVKRFFEISNLSELFEIPEDEQRKFYINCLPNILNLMLKCSFVADKAFLIFNKLFSDRKRKIAEKIKEYFINFYASSRSDKLIKFSIQIENFWIKLEEFLRSNVELMREILLTKFKNFHPLIHSLVFNVEIIQNLYQKYCTKVEIEEILQESYLKDLVTIDNQNNFDYKQSELVKIHFEKSDKMEKFFIKKFLLISNENGNSMLSFLKENLKNNKEGKLKYQKILTLCLDFLKIFLNENQIEKVLYKNSQFDYKTILNEQEIFILKNLDEIYKKANWHDVLQMLLLNDYDDMDDTPYFKNSRKELMKILEKKNGIC
ncbi:hypothetical protein PVAND_016098 [Polypedilum vanderplanki]|uniref:NACHT domain-containing protein n=1 Tax=Polypedilum vanderplanki TaxID=319348 RepID=A0A9J6BEL8_POLVA|nr:hypothetical protein PVAND_016098 [Polypedilum vanderplanki]